MQRFTPAVDSHNMAAVKAIAASGVIIGLLAMVGCAAPMTGARPAPFPGARSVPADAPVASGPVADILATALTMAGEPYVYGGADPRIGFDCSGLVWYVFGVHDVVLPRTTADQYAVGRRISLDDVTAGDLVFFSTTSDGPSHVGIALDNHTVIHAPSTGTTVRIEPFDTPYWQRRVIGARRVLVAP